MNIEINCNTIDRVFKDLKEGDVFKVSWHKDIFIKTESGYIFDAKASFNCILLRDGSLRIIQPNEKITVPKVAKCIIDL